MRGRGIDFEHRFNTSRWAEDLLAKALSDTPEFLCFHFGLSEVKTDGELVYGMTDEKEPDLLVYEKTALTDTEKRALENVDLTKIERDQFKTGNELAFVISKAIAALEVEFSPYKASEMKDRNWLPRTKERWEKRPVKNATPPTAPNIWVKEEDLAKLCQWEKRHHVPIVVTHIFDQEGFAVDLQRIVEFDSNLTNFPEETVKRQVTTGIFKKIQSYDRVDAQGAGEKKTVFLTTPNAAVKIGDIKNVHVSAQLGLSSSKKYVTHALFTGGKIEVNPEFTAFLRGLK